MATKSHWLFYLLWLLLIAALLTLEVRRRWRAKRKSGAAQALD
jgi:hypothetical protein